MSSDVAPCAAVLTPAGRGAVAVVGVWGCGATAAVARSFLAAAGRPLSQMQIGRVVFGRWLSPDGEELVVCRRDAEELEIHCHGGSASTAAILETLAAAGCRIADARDWLARRQTDRTIVEAYNALSRAPTARVADILLDQAGGALRHAIDEIVADFSSGDEFKARNRLTRLLARAAIGLRLTEPFHVVFTGPPNVGKSSLVNALLGYGRAIVHHEPGTTRDIVTARAVFAGRLVELSDTAGIRATDDALEAAGVAQARRQALVADLVVTVFDRSRPATADEAALMEANSAGLFVYNKADLPPTQADDHPAGIRRPGVATSALTGQGIDDLIAAIVARPEFELPPPGTPVPFTARQIELLHRAQAAGDATRSSAALAEI